MAEQDMDLAPWTRYARTFVVTFTGLLAFLSLSILLVNPYGNLPNTIFRHHEIMDINQRWQYPAIIRSQEFDSLVIGNSTSRLFRPALLNEGFGGRFANLAMNSGLAWEQYRTAKLFFQEIRNPRTLLIGLDHVWCTPHADKERITKRGFPEWMWDQDPWNDLLYMLNSKAVEIAGRRLGEGLGLKAPRIPFDGYEVFVPPEAEYDLARAKKNIGEGSPPINPPQVATPAIVATWQYPALEWFEELLSLKWQNVVLTITPVHVNIQPQVGSLWAEQEALCKQRLANIAAKHGYRIFDFRIHSPITRRDENYWDPLHYRVPVADDVVHRLIQAYNSPPRTGDGTYVTLSPAAED